MRRFALWAPICALAIMTLAGPSFGQGAYNKAAFESAMEDAVKQMRVVLGTLIGADWAKAQDGCGAIAAQAKKIRTLTPKVGADRIAEYQAHADTLEARANRLGAAVKARDGARAAVLYGETVATCMDCHKIFRK
jgi:cytochrome c556